MSNTSKGYTPFLPLLCTVPLFNDMDADELSGVLDCMDARINAYDKMDYLFTAGDAIRSIGIVLEGSLHVLREDITGSASILALLQKGDLFGEVFVCAHVPTIPVSVFAASACCVLFLDYARVLHVCTAGCPHHSKLIANMLSLMATKNLYLSQKMELLSKRSIRDKLLAYLHTQAMQTGTLSFTIPFNREQLADYLCVDRSALSKELGRMKRDGLIDFDRSRFLLHAGALSHMND